MTPKSLNMTVVGSLDREGADSGFSVVETLIAAALLLVITIGILPFFTGAIVNNVQGAQATEVSQQTKSKLEELYQLPFNSPQLTIPVGQTELNTTEYYSSSQKKWIDSQDWAALETPRYTRTIRVRQFGISALDDNREFDDDEALPAGSTPSFIHLKEIEVEVRTPEQIGAFGPGKRARFRVYKPF